MTANYTSNSGADPPPGELARVRAGRQCSSQRTVNSWVDVTASAHPEAGLLAILARNGANLPSEDATESSQPVLAAGDSARAAVSELLSAARTFRDAQAASWRLPPAARPSPAGSRASESAEVVKLQRTAAPASSARRDLASRRSKLAALAVALRKSVDQDEPPLIGATGSAAGWR